jgi:hypothetical protein
MSAKFKILFAIELLNEYYTSLRCFDFKIVPSAETMQLMKDSKMIYKVINNQLLVLSKVYDSGPEQDKPLVSIAPGKKFVFYLDLIQPVFMNITNLDLDLLASRRFYFSNAHQNKKDNVLYLSDAIKDYDATATYLPGMLASDGTNIFECISNTPDASSVHHDTTETAFWKSRGKFQYPSSNDLIRIVGKICNFRVSPAASVFNVSAFKLNTTTNHTYDVEVPLKKKQPLCFYDTDDPTVKDVQVDLSELPPGRYRIMINSHSFDVYVDDYATQYFGVMEFFNHLGGTNEFALLDASGKIKDTVVAGSPKWLNFVIRFANRFAFRRFVSTKRGISSIIADGGEYSFATVSVPPPPLPSVPADVFISDKPIPMYDKQNIFKLVLTTPITSDPIKAPNPNPLVPGVLTRYQTDFYCTIYLNY